ASTNGATVKAQTIEGRKYQVLTFMAPNKAAVNGYINDQNLVEKVETWLDNAMLGDMLFDARYSEYKDFGGVKFPMKIVQTQGGHPIVDFTDYIVVIEGPQSEERASAIIAEAKRLIPGKPIRYVVNTHHHIAPSSGLRTFVAEGATVITHEINKPYFEKIFSAPHTLNPDKLAQAKRKASFETMTEKKVL